MSVIAEVKPRAVMLENVKGFLDPSFAQYRALIVQQLTTLGYRVDIKLLNACDYGVPQLRPRVVIVALCQDEPGIFSFPAPLAQEAPHVGTVLVDLMAEQGWRGAQAWARGAQRIAPTLVGGSKKHGGPDLGPTRARQAWAELGVDGKGVDDRAPAPDFVGMPRLTPRMLARLQGFPDTWTFGPRKTAACRMIGNALPPPLAQAVGLKIKEALTTKPKFTEPELKSEPVRA